MKHRTSEVTQVWAEEEKNYGCGWFCSSWKALENGKMIVWSWKSKFEGSHWDLRGAMSYALLSSKPSEKSIRNWGSDSQLCQWDTGLSDITLICRPDCFYYLSLNSHWTACLPLHGKTEPGSVRVHYIEEGQYPSQAWGSEKKGGAQATVSHSWGEEGVLNSKHSKSGVTAETSQRGALQRCGQHYSYQQGAASRNQRLGSSRKEGQEKGALTRT